MCEESCPYDAIDIPVVDLNPEGRSVTARKLILVSLLVPFFIVLGGWTGSRLHETLAGVNGKVRLAKILLEPERYRDQPEPFEVTAYKSSGKPLTVVYDEAAGVLRRFYTGGWLLGCFIGLVFGMILAGRLLTRYSTDYTPNKGACFSCARCVDYCPVEKNGTKEVKP